MQKYVVESESVLDSGIIVARVLCIGGAPSASVSATLMQTHAVTGSVVVSSLGDVRVLAPGSFGRSKRTFGRGPIS